MVALDVRGSRGVVTEGNGPPLFGCCYIAGTGKNPDRDQAFVPGVGGARSGSGAGRTGSESGVQRAAPQFQQKRWTASSRAPQWMQ